MQLNLLVYKNFVWRGFYYLTTFALSIGIARSLGAERSGELYFFLNNISLVLLIGSMSLESGITYFVSKGEIDSGKLASFSVLWAISLSTLIAVLFYFFYKGNPLFFKRSILLIASLSFIMGNFLTAYFSAFFYSHANYKVPNLWAGLINLILLFLIPWKTNWLGFIGEQTFLIIFFVATLVQGVGIFFFWFFKGDKLSSIQLFSFKEISPVIKYSVTALVGNFIFFLLYRIDYWFVEYYCMPKSFGNYVQVSRVLQVMVLPCTIIAATLFPESAKQNVSFAAKYFMKLFYGILITYLFVSFSILLFGQSIILFLWGKEFNEMFEPLLITLPGVLCLAISYLFSPIFAGLGKIRYNVYIGMLTLGIVVIFNFLLVPSWGIRGAAISTSVGFLFMMIIYLIIAKQKFDFSFKNIINNVGK